MERKRETEYVTGLGELGDTLTVRFTSELGAIVAFTVQYEAWIDGRRYPVTRCDTAHGFAHWDILDRHGNVVTKAAVTGPTTYNDAMTAAIAYLNAHWSTERDAFNRRAP